MKKTIMAIFAVVVFILGIFFFFRAKSDVGLKKPGAVGIEAQNSKETIAKDPLTQEWNILKIDNRFQKCLQSQNDMSKLVGDLEPEYRQTLEKETDGSGLTKQDRYVRYIYGLWQARAKDYSIFDSFNNAMPPKGNLDSMRNLLDYIYCPDMTNVSSKFPASVESCQEAVQAWMNPFEIPMPQNFKFPEEYELAKKKFKTGLASTASNAKSCCLGETTSRGACENLKEFMK